jgi:ATP-dependent RNA helicase RhlE
VPIERQLKKLRSGVDVVIATPGRLLDHIGRHTIDLRHVEFFVLDEADRMFDMGFIQDVRMIMAKVRRSSDAAFSATLSSEVKRSPSGTEKCRHHRGGRTEDADRHGDGHLPVARDRKLTCCARLEGDGWDAVLVPAQGQREFGPALQHAGVDAAGSLQQVASGVKRLEGLRAASTACSSRPTSPRADSTSTASRTW